MKKAFCLLLLLLMVAALPALAEPRFPLSDEETIALFFPGHQATLGDNFLYTLDPPAPDFMGNPTTFSYRVKETQRIGDLYAIVLEGRGEIHVDGYRSLLFGVYDPARGLVGDALSMATDWSDYMLFYQEGEFAILYIGGSKYTGLEAYTGAAFRFTGTGFEMMWPTGEDPDYWFKKKPELNYGNPGSLILYEMVPDVNGESLSDYTWRYLDSETAIMPPSYREWFAQMDNAN